MHRYRVGLSPGWRRRWPPIQCRDRLSIRSFLLSPLLAYADAMALVVAAGNLKGGVGKSTLAVNLACELAGSCRVHLVDADAQATATEWLNGGNLPVAGEALPLDDERHAGAWIKRVTARARPIWW